MSSKIIFYFLRNKFRTNLLKNATNKNCSLMRIDEIILYILLRFLRLIRVLVIQ